MVKQVRGTLGRDWMTGDTVARRLSCIVALGLLLTVSRVAPGQSLGETKFQVSGAGTITSKGISVVPAFTLGKPAALFDLSVQKGDLAFEPQFQFGLDGKPWQFLLWGRYRPDLGPHFHLTLGAHPAFSFSSVPSGECPTCETLQVSRYLAGEFAPSYSLTRRVAVTAYYLYGHGLDPTSAKAIHFAAAQLGLTEIPLGGRLTLALSPQAYYAWSDGEEGTYVSAEARVNIRALPFSILAFANQPIRTTLRGGEAFVWSLSLRYGF